MIVPEAWSIEKNEHSKEYKSWEEKKMKRYASCVGSIPKVAVMTFGGTGSRASASSTRRPVQNAANPPERRRSVCDGSQSRTTDTRRGMLCGGYFVIRIVVLGFF